MIPKQIFFIHLNFNNDQEFCHMTDFNEFCLMTVVLTCKDDFKLKIYTNKPVKYLRFPKLSQFIENEIIDSKLLEEAERLKIGSCPSFSSGCKYSHISDFLRYSYLLSHGGVYIDTDIIIKENLSKLIEDYEFVASKEGRQKINSGFIMSVPDNPIIKDTLQSYYDDYKPSMWTYNAITVLNKYIKEYSDKIKMNILEYKRGPNYPNWKELEILESKEIDIPFITMFNTTVGHHICGATVSKGAEIRSRISELLNDNSFTTNQYIDGKTYLDWLVSYLYVYMKRRDLV